MKPLLRIAMVMPRIDQRDYFLYLFSQKYTIVLDTESPQIVLYDDYSKHLVKAYKHTPKPVYIAYTGESRPIDYRRCHFALSFDENNRKSVYLPFWVLGVDWFDTGNPDYCKLTDIKGRLPLTSVNRELFCGFIARNPVENRNMFVQSLSKYKTVTCPGEVMNNYPRIGGSMGKTKEDFLRKCKFTVAFENTGKDGYITEKILHAFQARTIPIYWGSPTIERYFNPRAFINCHNYASWGKVIEDIKRLDNNDEEYLTMINEPVFKDDVIPEQFLPENIMQSIQTKL